MRLSAASGSVMSYIENTQSSAAERKLHPEHGDALRAVRFGMHTQPAEAVYYAQLLSARLHSPASPNSHARSQQAASGHRLPQTCLEER
jgi:hypothetical protein